MVIMMKVTLDNIRPVRNMFKRYGCPTESLEEVASTYEKGKGQRRMWVRFSDRTEAQEAFELLAQTDEESLRVEKNFDADNGLHEIILSIDNRYADNQRKT